MQLIHGFAVLHKYFGAVKKTYVITCNVHFHRHYMYLLRHGDVCVCREICVFKTSANSSPFWVHKKRMFRGIFVKLFNQIIILINDNERSNSLF